LALLLLDDRDLVTVSDVAVVIDFTAIITIAVGTRGNWFESFGFEFLDNQVVVGIHDDLIFNVRTPVDPDAIEFH
jgi:hypothetical protein